MSEERKRVLKMIEAGKITADEGLDLLKALEETTRPGDESPLLRNRFLRVQITSQQGENVDVNIPLSLLKIASKFASLLPEEAKQELVNKGIDLQKFNFEEVIKQINAGLSDGMLVDVKAHNEDGELTEIRVYVQ